MFHLPGTPPHEQTWPAVCACLQDLHRPHWSCSTRALTVNWRSLPNLVILRTSNTNREPYPGSPVRRPRLPCGMFDARYAGGSMRLRKSARLFVSEQREEPCCMQQAASGAGHFSIGSLNAAPDKVGKPSRSSEPSSCQMRDSSLLSPEQQRDRRIMSWAGDHSLRAPRFRACAQHLPLTLSAAFSHPVSTAFAQSDA